MALFLAAKIYFSQWREAHLRFCDYLRSGRGETAGRLWGDCPEVAGILWPIAQKIFFWETQDQIKEEKYKQ